MLFNAPRPPIGSHDKEFSRWTYEQFQRLANFVNFQPRNAVAFEPILDFSDLPTNILEGTVVYAPETVPNGPGKGLNYWDGEKWVRSTPAVGYGGISQRAGAALINPGLGWTLLPADTEVITNPVAVDQNVDFDALAFQLAGMWSLSISFSMTHNELNAGRTSNIRLLNTNTGLASTGVLFSTARNTDVTAFSINVLFEVQPAQLGDNISLQMGGGSTYSELFLNSMSFSATLLAEF